MNEQKIVYVGMVADFLHPGHINIIKEARKLGTVTVGLLTDEAVSSYKRIPIFSFKQRSEIVENIKGVSSVIPQTTLDYIPNLEKIKPDYVVHGDDWKTGYMKEIRKNCIKALNSYGGKLIEVPYTKGVSSAAFIDHLNKMSTTPDIRRAILKKLINSEKLSRFIETHNPISAIIAETTYFERNGRRVGFDGFWSSSLTDSTALGKPDNESLSNSQRMLSIDQIFDVTTKPLVFDADNGGQIEHLPYLIRSLERSGVSAIIMEDKVGLKKNSLFKNQSGTKQDKPNVFAKKIKKIWLILSLKHI